MVQTLLIGGLQSLDWNGGREWLNGIVECVLQGERSLPMQFSTSDLLEDISLFSPKVLKDQKLLL